MCCALYLFGVKTWLAWERTLRNVTHLTYAAIFWIVPPALISWNDQLRQTLAIFLSFWGGQ